MLVSIVIPLYNTEKYIRETVNSVLNQSYKEIEVLLVDDGSDDKSAEIVKSIKDERLIYIYQDNAGVSEARNNGFRHSKGSFLAFLDSDDVLVEDCIENKLAIFATDKEFGLVHSNMQVIDEDSNQQSIIYSGKEGWILNDLLSWKETCIPSPSSILVKREVVDEVGGFDVDLSTAADQEFFFRVAKKFKIGKVDKVLGYYRMHDSNMHSNITVMERDHILAFKKAKEYGFFGEKGFERKCFANLYKTIGASYWKDANMKIKGGKLVFKAICLDPFVLLR